MRRKALSLVDICENLFLDCGIANANLGSTDAKCELNTSDALTGSVKIFLLLASLTEDRIVLRFALFLLLFIK